MIRNIYLTGTKSRIYNMHVTVTAERVSCQFFFHQECSSKKFNFKHTVFAGSFPFSIWLGRPFNKDRYRIKSGMHRHSEA